ncbi:MAG: phosphoethanolamine transferase, partial [Bacteroidales bacterium]|nr:phosphoethanolamine transferase [Bacteroidales bacterium]
FMDYKNFILGNWLFLLECESPNLIEYKQEPSVECGDKKPDFIVLVVGESFSKEHSSLYDYDKETNPLLKKLVTDSSLFVCNDVVSACTKTIPAMKSIMTSYVDEMRDSIDWYQCLTLIEIMQSINYRSVWVSNQSRVGFFDNVSGCFAELCDESVFANERGLNGYDEVLLPIIHDIVDSDSLQMFLIVNLMGSHISYNSRYPASFSNFEPDDSVVYEIIKIFEQKDAFVLYISDHGQDVFKSSNEYAGHAINGNPVSEQVSVKIPMFFYTSPAFLNKHPELYNRIRSTINRPYRTDSVMYTIMDVAGIETVNGVSYKHKSLFK